MKETSYELPDLEYDYSALEPFIDAKTMEIHHTKHHNAYLVNLKNTNADLSLPIEELLLKYNDVAAIRNHGGGFYNHCLFWKMMKPNGGGEPNGALKAAIDQTFGGFEAFKEALTKAAAATFGSGWAWLLKEKKSGELKIVSKPNQDHPDVGNCIPILGVDVWEHAYYLKYQNRRPEYLSAWFNVINWEFAQAQFNK